MHTEPKPRAKLDYVVCRCAKCQERYGKKEKEPLRRLTDDQSDALLTRSAHGGG